MSIGNQTEFVNELTQLPNENDGEMLPTVDSADAGVTDGSVIESDDTTSLPNENEGESLTTVDSSDASATDGSVIESDDTTSLPNRFRDEDMQMVRDYVSSVLDAKTKLVTIYLSSIDNFQVTVQTASPTEAKPDFLGVVLKVGLKTAEKKAVAAVKDATGADLGPLVELIHGIKDEIEKAGKSAENLGASVWIKNIRATITNAYTQDSNGEDLRKQLEDRYDRMTVEECSDFVLALGQELNAMQSIKPPLVQSLELSMYSAWINESFNDDCIDGTGIIHIVFDDDGNSIEASVTAPLGSKIAGGLNDVMATAGVNCLMDLDVVKKVCKGDACMCFEGNNTVRKHVEDEDVESFILSKDLWEKVKIFSA